MPEQITVVHQFASRYALAHYPFTYDSASRPCLTIVYPLADAHQFIKTGIDCFFQHFLTSLLVLALLRFSTYKMSLSDSRNGQYEGIKLFVMFIGPCIIVITEEQKTNQMPLIILLYFLQVQHVTGITMPIIRSSRL